MGERIKLFEQALGIERPWYVERTECDAEDRRLDIHLNFEVGGTFACSIWQADHEGLPAGEPDRSRFLDVACQRTPTGIKMLEERLSPFTSGPDGRIGYRHGGG